MSNKTYDILKYIALVVYPAIITLTATIMTALGCKNTEIVIIIMNAIATFLGTILGISNANYKKENKKMYNDEEGRL